VRKIVTIQFGSHLYGTSTPTSDVDIKSVYVPGPRDIALQRVKGSISNKRTKLHGEKNFAGEIDEESYSLQRFLSLAAEGQTVALDILFAPEWAMTEPPAKEWLAIIQNRERLLTRKSGAFLGYCRQQANKYGIKGSRVAAARSALVLLNYLMEQYPSTSRLGTFDTEIAHGVSATEHHAIIDIENGSTGVAQRHWEVCGRKLSFSSSIKSAHDIVKRLVDEYGHRALQAESQQGVDWKALSHAVRVGTQALELLATAHVTFPLPNAAHILEIKTGKLPYQAVAEEIEELLIRVEAAAAMSSLPESADRAWIDEFVYTIHAREVWHHLNWMPSVHKEISR
jgi:predicted nucleotidyltransferase